MLKELFTALLCSFAIAGQMRAQEAEVAREAKPNPTERVAPVSERTDSESETVTKTKSQGREKKSASSVITVEQMRMAGALAAERTSSVEGSSLQGPKAATLAERQKTETGVEQANAHWAPTAQSTNSEALSPGSVRGRIIVSVRDQKLMFVQSGAKPITYPVSTSKFGLGDDWGRMTTPLGFLQIVQKIGDNAPTGAVFHNRRWTGEILQANAPGRDPIVTRIIWLRGLEMANAHAFSRCIYIHGTPQEKMIGRPASYGCIRMRSNDVAALFSRVTLGTIVQIVPDHLPSPKQALIELAAPLVGAPPKNSTARL